MDTYRLKRENANFIAELDLLYMVYLASEAEKLDAQRLSSALHLVWRHMCHIEERVSELLDENGETEPIADKP